MRTTLKRVLFSLALLLSTSAGVSAQLFSEFEPNPAGGDPDDTTIELSGDASTAFDFWILELENDGFSGIVDRAANVTGSFDASGLAIVTIPDLENPTFTVILTDNFTGAIGDDLDALDDGTLNLATLGNILDSVGVSDATADDATLYGSILGGTDILFNGQFDPLNVFRDASTGDFFQSVTVDFGEPTARIGVFAANGGPELDNADFSFDPTTPTLGSVNPSFGVVTIPEPSSLALLFGGLVSLTTTRRRK